MGSVGKPNQPQLEADPMTSDKFLGKLMESHCGETGEIQDAAGVSYWGAVDICVARWEMERALYEIGLRERGIDPKFFRHIRFKWAKIALRHGQRVSSLSNQVRERREDLDMIHPQTREIIEEKLEEIGGNKRE